MLTSQANELTENSGKKTITVISDANVRRALDLLGFEGLAPIPNETSEAAMPAPSSKKRKMKKPATNLSREELLRMQQELFQGSKQRMEGGS